MIKIIAFIVVYNEEDVIEKCIENAIEQGLDVIVIDNGCTDGTIAIAKALDIPVLKYKTAKYNVFECNEWAISQAKKIGCDWYVAKDADEIFETHDRRKIVEAVNEADNLGYNCMRFDMYEFWPTVDDDLSITDFTERIQYYSYFSSRYLKMIKNSPEILTDSHHAPKGVIKESPIGLILRHYKFIGLEQGRRKVKTRRDRIANVRGVCKQYNNFTYESRFYVLEKEIYQRLNKFNGTWIKEKVFDGWRGY